MITVVSLDNSEWELVYNEKVILPDMSSRLTFDTPFMVEIGINTMSFLFLNDGEKLAIKADIVDKDLQFKLYQWEGTHIENKNATILSNNGKRYAVKYQTTAGQKNNMRSFTISIWLEKN